MRIMFCLAGLLSGVAAYADDEPVKKVDEKTRLAQLEALEPFNALIAEWNGNGFVPGKDKNKTGWEEKSQWVWQLKGDVCIKFAYTGGKVLSKGTLFYDTKLKQYLLKAVRADKTEATYVGEFDEGNKKKMNFTTELSTKEVEKITMDFSDSIRVKVMVERTKPGKDPVLAYEIGATKKGEKISGSTESGPKCLITGGPGTSSVGGGYFVCCTGCRDAYNENPAKWIAFAKKKGYIQ